jgi:hypothetical protein
MFPCFYVSGVPETNGTKKENAKVRFFATNGKWKGQTSVCLLQRETENEILFSLIGKQ